ncbi:unnamed protein product [Effrenium voratum]|nr:unnamed protein product [Effrenium voratum]
MSYGTSPRAEASTPCGWCWFCRVGSFQRMLRSTRRCHGNSSTPSPLIRLLKEMNPSIETVFRVLKESNRQISAGMESDMLKDLLLHLLNTSEQIVAMREFTAWDERNAGFMLFREQWMKAVEEETGGPEEPSWAKDWRIPPRRGHSLPTRWFPRVRAAVIPEGANSTFRRRRLVGREVMAAAKAMACLERIMQDVDPAARQLFTYQEMRLVLQRMREEARQEARLVEAKHIKELGLNLDQVQAGPRGPRGIGSAIVLLCVGRWPWRLDRRRLDRRRLAPRRVRFWPLAVLGGNPSQPTRHQTQLVTQATRSVADDLDRASEEKKSPHNYEGWAYVILTPWLGLAIFILGFPVLWWNERRATGRKAPPAPAAAMGGAASPAEGSPVAKGTANEKVPRDAEAVEGTPVKQEGESLLVHPEKAYHEAVESFETQHCNYLCCRGVKRCFEAMPQLEGAGDFRTYFFRVFGVCMMFTGIDMMLAPTYFMLRNAWFFGFLIAAHLAICACKSSCILSCCTILSSYVLHRPGIVALLAPWLPRRTAEGHTTLGMHQRVREPTKLRLRVKFLGSPPWVSHGCKELRELFKRLDPHGTGLLTEVQVELALRALGVEMPHEACAAVAFRVFDFDLSGSIDFLEFLHMIVMAKGQEGPFKSPEDQKVTSLAKLERCDLLYLMNAMRARALSLSFEPSSAL